MATTQDAFGPLSVIRDATTGEVLAIVNKERDLAIGPDARYTSAQLSALAAAGGLTTYATYIDQYGTRYFASGPSTLETDDAPINCANAAFGGYWDGVNDDSAAITAAAAYAATFTPKKSIVLPPTVGVSSSIYIPDGVHVFGHEYGPGKINTRVIPLAGMSLTTGFVFNFNTTDGTSAVVSVSGSEYRCGIFGIEAFGSASIAGFRLATFANNFIARDIRGYRTTQLLKKVPGLYVDVMNIKRINSLLSYDNSEYQIELSSGGGDAYLLEQLAFSNAESGPQLAIKVSSGQNGRITNIINGAISLNTTPSFSIESHHAEIGYLYVNDSSGRVSNSKYQVADAHSHTPIECVVSGSNVNYTIDLESCEFGYGTGVEGTNVSEVKKADQYTLTTTDCRRVISMTNGQRAYQGIRVSDNSNALIGAWTTNSWYLSVRGSMSKSTPNGSHATQIVADFNGLYNAPNKVTGSGNSTLVNGTTYYYISQLLFDSARSIGRNQSAAERSVTMDAANQRVGMAFGWGTGSQSGIIRVYRGTTTGSYDQYVDLPLIRSLYIVDNGSVCNGVTWQARGAAAVDAITSVAAGTWIVTPIGKVVVA